MFPLVETIKCLDGKLFLLDLHQKRMDRSYQQSFKSKNTVIISNCLNELNIPSQGLYKIRLLYSEAAYHIEYQLYNKRNIQSIELVESSELEYSIKKTERSVFENMVSKSRCDDVIITKGGFLTDASYSNIILFDGETWVTPENPLLEGVQRRNLLDKAILKIARIHKNDLKKFKKIALINAMMDFEDRIELPITAIVI
ncbi:MAG: hypothetical protein CL663_06625 [Bacteroidetes bacterium]|nr:hypothetical protein [Bacteroidota bacterium]|tara:strand:+ start:28 stop:624 length:597 start_codon:yes stop_codon:yes gene_type:complete